MAISQHSRLIGEGLATRSEVRSARGVVSAGHPLAVRAGLQALEAGGNAVDAVVAGAFAAFVVEPNNAGVGGYGHLSAFLAAEGFVTVDHGPRAPLAARPEMFELVSQPTSGYDWPGVVGDHDSVGGLAVAAPGAVAGLWAIHERAGRMAWPKLLEQAIAIAEDGLEVTWSLALEIAGRQEEIRAHHELAEILLPGGRLPRSRTADAPGARLDQRALAATLRRIAVEGPRAFYDGGLAAAIAAAVCADGGILTREDLASYEPKVLTEAPARYRGLDYVTANDQVGYEALNILENFPLGDWGAESAEHLHLLAEAMGHAFVDNVTYYGDPDHTESPVAGLAAPAFAALRAASIRLDRAAARPIATADPWPFDPQDRRGSEPTQPSRGGLGGTTQVVAGDGDGNLVALITTIGGDFGSLVAVPGTGIVLNNSMRNYDPRPGRSNSIAPAKMPFFAVPAIVAAGPQGASFAAAGSGGYPILAGVLSTFVNVVDHGLAVQAAIDAPRVHSQGDRTYVDARVPAAVRDRLVQIGHELEVQAVTPGELPFSRVSAVVRVDGELQAGCGPEWNTAAGGL